MTQNWVEQSTEGMSMIVHKNKSNRGGMILHDTNMRVLYLAVYNKKLCSDLLGSSSREGKYMWYNGCRQAVGSGCKKGKYNSEMYYVRDFY